MQDSSGTNAREAGPASTVIRACGKVAFSPNFRLANTVNGRESWQNRLGSSHL
jgi:hypothetical protein